MNGYMVNQGEDKDGSSKPEMPLPEHYNEKIESGVLVVSPEAPPFTEE